MEKKESNKNTGIFLHEVTEEKMTGERSPLLGKGRMRKMLVYILMAVAFAGCLYLIFRPDESEEKGVDEGLNNAVPQAGNAELVGDKEKAYERELLEKKENERRKSMLSLSDYWNDETDSTKSLPAVGGEPEPGDPASEGVKNYREIQNTLGSFYQPDAENQSLRREIRELKEKAKAESSEKNETPDPIELMEKSYQMAAKYLPQVMPQKQVVDSVKKVVTPERYVEPVYTAKRNVVSSLYRDKEQSDREFMESVLNGSSDRLFNGQSSASPNPQLEIRNSIRACIHRTQVVTLGSSISLRLLEGARIARMNIPAGTLLTAIVVNSDARLKLQVSSVEYKGNIVPVDLSAYGLDGQPGLNLPYSPDVNAFKEIASGMSSSAGTNIVLSSSTGQQLTSDLTKGVVQGVSGYVAKRIGSPKITVKSGDPLFLVPKKQ
ncbi:conjugative transposon protein TraM [Chryseobacterium populi]|uniref:Conjugative transposon TraM protein n=1 Tax=Chryseobacterium populi TaxID=1144316 RepID=J2K2J1_9FLAO|nr:conjugative transposon protein TraM [Chryseobacterium populi]EJL74375.1 conjugative transposon TraM protein [Chryseobacterium populi]